MFVVDEVSETATTQAHLGVHTCKPVFSQSQLIAAVRYLPGLLWPICFLHVHVILVCVWVCMSCADSCWTCEGISSCSLL